MHNGTIKFVANDKWMVVDLYRFFHALNVLYNRLYAFHFYVKQGSKDLQDSLIYSLYYVEEGDQLIIDRIRMESPAKFNLRGAGEIIEQLREFFKDIKYRNRIEKEILQTTLMRNLVSLMKEAGYTDEEIKDTIGILLPPANKIKKQIDKNDIKVN